MNTIETISPPQNNEALRTLAENLKHRAFNKSQKLRIIASKLHSVDPEGFKVIDNLTWPEGQAVLLTSDRQIMERTNRSACIREIPKSEYVIDTGLDNTAMRRLLEMMMRRLGYELGIINQLKALFEVEQPARYSDW